MRYPKPPYFLERERVSLTDRNSAISSTSHNGRGGGGLSLRGRWVPKRSGGLITHDGSITFDPSMRSPNTPYWLESARASITTRYSASSITSSCGSSSGGVSTSRHLLPERSGGLFPQDGSLPLELSVIYPKTPSCSEISRASLTASNSASANNSHRESGGRGASMSGRGVPERSGGLFHQYDYLNFEFSVSSPNPPSFSDSAHDSLNTSASAITSHCGSSGGGVSLSRWGVLKLSVSLFPLIGLITSKR